MMTLCPTVQKESSKKAIVKKKPLYLLGLHPFTGAWPGGNTIEVAVEMALDHINANNSILQDYELIHTIADSGVSPWNTFIVLSVLYLLVLFKFQILCVYFTF